MFSSSKIMDESNAASAFLMFESFALKCLQLPRLHNNPPYQGLEPRSARQSGHKGALLSAYGRVRAYTWRLERPLL